MFANLSFHLTRLYQSRFAYVASFLMLTLQRSPVMLHLGKIQQALGRPLIQMSRAIAPLAVFFGGTHAVTGATAVVPAGESAVPANATVGEEFTWAFRVVGETAASFSVRGLPAGLAKSQIVSRGVSSFTGIPEEAGTFEVEIIGWRGKAENGSATPSYTLVLNVDGGEPPSITTQPAGGAYDLGANAFLEVGIAGSRARYRWLKDGQEIPASSTQLIDETTARQVLVPKAAVDDAWFSALEFDDSTWVSGTGGVGFERTADSAFAPQIQLDIEAEAFARNASALIRVPFVLSEADLLRANQLTLRLKYDDGYVAYLNGARISEANAPARLLWNSRATAEHDRAAAVEFVDIDLTDHFASLQPGTNLLALHALNFGPKNADFLCSAELIVSHDPNRAKLQLPGLTEADAGDYVVEVSNASGAITSEVATIQLAGAASPYETWKNDRLASVANQDLTGPSADADGDGLSNLVEFYYGSDPMVRTNDRNPRVEMIKREGQERIEMRFPRTNTTGVLPVFESSSTLAADSWQPMASDVEGIVIVHTELESVISMPIGSGERFVRLTLLIEE